VPEPTLLRLAAYTRLSQSNPHEGESHAAQLDRIVAWASVNRHQVVGHCLDTVSGENGAEDRPGFLDALGLIDDGGANGIVVASLDRLARKLSTQEALLATVWTRDAQVLEIGMGIVPRDDASDPYRTFVRQVMGAAAQLERALIVKRMADGRRRAVSRGRSIGPAPAFGWIKDPDDPGRMLPDRATFPLVEKVVAQLTNGATLQEAAEYLSSETERRWHPTQIARIRDRFQRYQGTAVDSFG
jgi:DNA invertase Pin-like site-specific DNA recombinase